MTVDQTLVTELNRKVGEALHDRDAADEAAGERTLSAEDRRQYARHLIREAIATENKDRLSAAGTVLDPDEDCEANDFGAISLSSPSSEATPAAANVEDALSARQMQLPAYQVELVLLCLVKRGGSLPVAATVRHLLV